MRMQKLVIGMKENAETISNFQVMEKILRILIERFNVITAIEESKDLNMMTIDGL